MSRSAADAAGHVGALRRTALSRLAEHLPRYARWTAIDYPMHFNVGDAAITLGQARLATEVGASLGTVLDRASYRSSLVSPDSLPVIAGGGNWGGLYPTHHKLRLRALHELRGREVVQMPQSIHYASPEHREELRRAVGEHGRLTLLVRDQRSHEVAAADYDCAVHLVPDLVLTLGRLPAPSPSTDVVVQGRTDREAQEASTDLTTFDWLEPPRASPSRAAFRAARLANRAQRRVPQQIVGPVTVATTRLLAQVNLRRGTALLGRGRYVVTDRLHGHVLAYLIGRPHVVVDDRYGKIRALHETWLADDPRSVLVSSWADVPAALDGLRERFPDA